MTRDNKPVYLTAISSMSIGYVSVKNIEYFGISVYKLNLFYNKQDEKKIIDTLNIFKDYKIKILEIKKNIYNRKWNNRQEIITK